MRIITTLTLSTVLVLNFIISFARRSVDPNSRAAQAPIAAPGSPQRLRQEIEAIEDLLPRLADRAAALYFLAGRYARLGEHARALALLKECVALDEGFTPSDAHGFASLKSNPEFRDLAESIRRRYPPVHHAHIALTLPQNDIFPEGLAVDVSTRHFFMSSEHQNKIVTFTEAGKISDFVKEGVYNLMPVGGVHIDPNDHSVWCATDPGEENRSELVHFDPQGKLLERYAAPGSGPHNLNDLVLRGADEIYTTDTVANQVFRFDRKSHTFAPLNLAAGKHGRGVFYPNGITLSDDRGLLFIADDLGVLRVDLRTLDLQTKDVQDVKPAAHDTLAGVDGLYWYKGSLVGVQYGAGAFRVMLWKLSPDGREVTSSKTLERATDLVRDPTTGAILDGNFYFMTNTGLDNLESGKVIDPSKLEPLHIAVVPLN